jgi:hypothetical protein
MVSFVLPHGMAALLIAELGIGGEAALRVG